MFVMLSVHTTTTVHERQADSVCKRKVNSTPSLSDKLSFISDKNIKQGTKSFQEPNLNNIESLNGTINTNKKLKNFNTSNKFPPSCETFDIIPSTLGNGTSILTPSKLYIAAPDIAPDFLVTQLNNYNKHTTVQLPVATILNDLSPIPAPVKVKNIESNNNPVSPMTPSGLINNTPDIKAMRYYRLWIYTCNAVLLMAVIVFCGVAGKVLLLDYRRLLVNGLSLTHPSFIYAYLALLVQSGFLQLVGCLGALRLSEKLLNAYWLLLLILLLGDAMLGIFWIYKFDKVMHDLKPILRYMRKIQSELCIIIIFNRYRLAHEYGNSIEFTELWDRLQIDGRCCGVSGPQDFTVLTNRTYPTSCCTQDITEQISITRRPLASAVVYRNDDVTISTTLRDQHRNLTDIAENALNHVITATRGAMSSSLDGTDFSSSSNSNSGSGNNKITIATCRAVYPQVFI
uniref:CSON003132 protein n=1 Tax=Culicoides sonorensis TaxID=179676 RepID=A0A336L376_CULSO